MTRWIAAVLLAASPAGPTCAASVCTAHADANSCSAESAARCQWMTNTRPCRKDEPCSPGTCSELSVQEPSRVATSSCACPDSSTAMCVKRGAATSCQPRPATCASGDVCACVAGSGESCAASATVGNLCECAAR